MKIWGLQKMIFDVCNLILASAVESCFKLDDVLVISRVLCRNHAPKVLPALLARGFEQLSPLAVAQSTMTDKRLIRLLPRSRLCTAIEALVSFYCSVMDSDTLRWLAASFPQLDYAQLMARAAAAQLSKSASETTQDRIATMTAIAAQHPDVFPPRPPVFAAAAALGDLDLLDWFLVRAAATDLTARNLSELLRDVPSNSVDHATTNVLDWWWDKVHDAFKLEKAREYFLIKLFVLHRISSVVVLDWWRANPLWIRPVGPARTLMFEYHFEHGQRDAMDWWLREYSDDPPQFWLLTAVDPVMRVYAADSTTIEWVCQAAREGDLAALIWMWDRTQAMVHPQKLNWTLLGRELVAAASFAGEISVLDWWYEKCRSTPKCSFRWSFVAVIRASGAGSIQALDWWLSRTQQQFMRWGNATAISKALTAATIHGRVKVLEWWHQLLADGRATPAESAPTRYLSAEPGNPESLRYWWQFNNGTLNKEQLATAWIWEFTRVARTPSLLSLQACWSMITQGCSQQFIHQLLNNRQLWTDFVHVACCGGQVETVRWWESVVLNDPAFPKSSFLSRPAMQHALTATVESGKPLAVHFWIDFAARHQLELALLPALTYFTGSSDSLEVKDWLFRWWQSRQQQQRTSRTFDPDEMWFALTAATFGEPLDWIFDRHVANGLRIICFPTALPHGSWANGPWWDAQEKRGCKFWMVADLAVPKLQPFWLVKSDEGRISLETGE
ncbi:hypothetical protein BC828DRAFT_152187 [Blastocladiella britannica]|nr:hypothetical protein BC828DRAFT_152187 [Blastocladiella britannica]